MLPKDETERRTKIIEKYGGISPVTEAFYIHSISYSAERSLSAYDKFNSLILSNENSSYSVPFMHEALGHAAGLSRFFWPSRNKKLHKNRGQKLRKSFSIDEHSPLKDRKIRDALEHFDERLDYFLLENDSGNFFPTPMIGSHTLAKEPTRQIFKLVDPDSHIFVILNEAFQYDNIFLEVKRIKKMADSFDKSGGRLPL